MGKNIHAFIHANGPDLEDHDLTIPCDDLPLETRRARWAEARKQKTALKVVPLRRFSGNVALPFLAPEKPKDSSRKAVVSELIRREFGKAVPKPKPEEEEPEQEPEELEPETPPEEEPEEAAQRAEAKPTSSLHRLFLPGVAGEVQDYFLRMSPQPSRIISLGVGLMVPTVLVSGSVIGPSGPKGCALHQTVVIVAPTAAGKQWGIDCAKECICEAGEGARQLLGPNRFKSGAALIRWVTEHRVSLCIQDEFGRLLSKFANPKSNPCEVEINDRMREFWAIGPGGIYNSPHGAAKLDDSQMIVDPRLSIFGFGVHEEFYTACQIEDISNGFLNRIATLDEPVALRLNTDFDGPDKVPYALKLNLEKLFGTKPRRLDWTRAAKEVYEAEVDRVSTDPDERRRKLWRIVRAASTFAASRFATRLERSDMEIAQTIMRHSDEVFRVGIDAAQQKRRLDHASFKIEIVRRIKTDTYLIRYKGETFYGASDFEMRRSFRHNSTHKKAVNDALDDLRESGVLRYQMVHTGGRIKQVNRLVEE
jgi:hypothetical protein